MDKFPESFGFGLDDYFRFKLEPEKGGKIFHFYIKSN